MGLTAGDIELTTTTTGAPPVSLIVVSWTKERFACNALTFYLMKA